MNFWINVTLLEKNLEIKIDICLLATICLIQVFFTLLQVKLSVLKEEKRLLMLQLKQREFQLRKEMQTQRSNAADESADDVPLDLMEDTEDDMEEMEQRFMSTIKQVQEFKNEKTQVDFRFDKFFFKYYFLLVFTLISINRKRKQLEILLRNSISKKFRQIENQLGFFHPWIPGPLVHGILIESNIQFLCLW